MLADYLRRIGLDTAPSPDAPGLGQLQRAHRLAIAFENLDIMLGRGIRLAPDAICAKLVGLRRGGYCFEQNSLFLQMLRAMGFAARPLLARVWLGLAGKVSPRTHMLLLVTIDGEQWIADVGFGGSYIPPIPLADGARAETPDGARHRLRRATLPGDPDGVWLLGRAGPVAATDGRFRDSANWQAQYGFAEIGVAAADIEQANHWTATRPGARFTSLHVASRVLPAGFASLTDRQLTVYDDGAGHARAIRDAVEFRQVLDEIFDFALSVDEVARLPLFADQG